MELTLAIHPISEIRAGGRTSLKASRLDVNTDELKQLLLEDRRLERVDIEFVRPGEAARLGYVFDVVEPRAKEPGGGSDFPGIIGPTERVGHGTTHVLRGAVVSVIAEGRVGSTCTEKRAGSSIGIGIGEVACGSFII